MFGHKLNPWTKFNAIQCKLYFLQTNMNKKLNVIYCPSTPKELLIEHCVITYSVNCAIGSMIHMHMELSYGRFVE